jgi:hypothetical protein
MAIAGGTFSVLGDGKFSNGAFAGAMTHLYNAEYDNLYKGLKGLWSKKGEILSDAGQGFKGGLKGYRDVMNEKNPRQPGFVNDMVKIGITAIETGATAGFGLMGAAYANHLSGFYSDAYSYFNPISFGTSYVADLTGVDRRIFK